MIKYCSNFYTLSSVPKCLSGQQRVETKVQVEFFKAGYLIIYVNNWLEFHREITTLGFLIDNLNVFSHPWLWEVTTGPKTHTNKQNCRTFPMLMHLESGDYTRSQPWINVKFNLNTFLSSISQSTYWRWRSSCSAWFQWLSLLTRVFEMWDLCYI